MHALGFDKTRLGLPRCRRLLQRTEFEQTFRANRLSNEWFTVYARANEQGFARLGMAVSKKVMPKAVTRNTAKRLIRETFRHEFPVAQALDVVVYARRRITSAEVANGRSALIRLLRAV